MTNDDAKLLQALNADHGRMKEKRQSYEATWNDVIDFLMPRLDKFGQLPRPDSEKGRERSQRMFDSTAPLALRNFVAAMDSMITPATQLWHRLKASNNVLNENAAVKAYLQEVVRVLFAVRYRWQGGFVTQMGATYQSVGLFGPGALMIEHDVGQGIVYRNVPMQRLWFAENNAGIIDKTHVQWELTLRQAAQRFGRENLSPSMQSALERDPEKSAIFYHIVEPRADRDPRKLDGRNMRFGSYWLDEGRDRIIQNSGFRTFPFAIGRFYVGTGDAYGGSPACDAMPDTRMVNEMAKTNIRGAQKLVDPPLLVSEDGVLEGFDLRSGSLNWGGLDEKGNEMVKPLLMGKQAQIGIEFTQDTRQTINQWFYVTLFQILVDSGDMTATEVLERAQEKGVLLAPTLGRTQSELLGPLIERELDILAEAAQLPEMPRELINAGANVEIEYDSPLNKAMRAGESAATLQWLQQLSVVAQFDLRAMKAPNGLRIARMLADAGGVPVEAMNTDEELQAQEAAEAQAMQVQQALAAAPVAAGAIKDLSDAQVNAQTARV
ncbi:portal protein [Burkholderia multivorans]|uniref:portal protein n=1 Tax=Burkholderia multivorans TaxID=87883 RepID=UPI002019A1E1|nr:portal protein [Burkholderia multivorans]UQN68279.1 portal protein [Burkholderia multivorans]UQN74008.1 portal protein [Burkholderia multivorans]